MNDQSRLRQLKTTAEPAHCYDHRTDAYRVRDSSVKRQASFNLVLVEDLDHAFGNTKTRHHEKRGLPVFANASLQPQDRQCGRDSATLTVFAIQLRAAVSTAGKRKTADVCRGSAELNFWRFRFERELQISLCGGAAEGAQLKPLAHCDELA